MTERSADGRAVVCQPVYPSIQRRGRHKHVLNVAWRSAFQLFRKNDWRIWLESSTPWVYMK